MTRFYITVLLLTVKFLVAGEMTIRHSLDDFNILNKDGNAVIQLNNLIDISDFKPEEGIPDLPAYIYKFEIPQGTTIENFKLDSFNEIELDGAFDLLPQEILQTQENKKQETTKNITVYKTNQKYPELFIQLSGVKSFNSVKIAHLIIHPLRYNPVTKKLYLISEINFSYDLQNSVNVSAKPLYKINLQQYSTLAVNSSQNSATKTEAVSAFNDLTSGLIDKYVIITASEFVDALQPLADWKTQKGVPTVIRSLDWIQSEFPEGVDLAEKMRNFIRWSYEQRGTKYVLLAGDTDIVPSRQIRTLWQGTVDYATDYYFSDLDGSWNEDEDAIFGEVEDLLDGYPETYVSRIPVRTVADIERFIYKLMQYEKFIDVDTSYQYPANVLYTAGNIERENDGYDLITKHIDPMINPSFTRKMLTQNNDIGSDGQVVLDELNKNYGLIFTESHGTAYTVRVGARNSNLYSYHMDALTNEFPAVWYIASCYTNDIRKRAISESYLLSPNGGGVAYIGNSSYEFPASGVYLEKEFFDLAFNRGYFHLAEAHFLSRLIYLGYLNYEGPSRIIVYSTVVLGDPEMPLWTEKPVPLSVTQKDSTIDGQLKFAIRVKNQNTNENLDGATVTLYKKGDIYKIEETDLNGIASFDRASLAADSVYLTVHKHNFIPIQEIVDFSSQSGPVPVLTEFSYIDESQNNTIEPGETVQLSFEIQNNGDSPLSSDFYAQAFCSHNQITGDSSIVNFEEAIQPSSKTTLGPFNFEVDASFTNDTTIFIDAGLYEDQYLRYLFSIPLKIQCPDIQITAADIYNIATINDSTFVSAIDLTIENKGNGSAYNINFSIEPYDSNTSIVSEPGTITQIDPQEAFSINQFCTISHIGLAELQQLNITILDTTLRSWKQNINFDLPLSANSVSFQPYSEDGILLEWNPSASADVLGYYIYRKASDEDNYSKITESPLPNAGYFIDENVNKNTQYQYFIESIDSSGNTSAVFSDTIQAWPTLPYQRNFPQQIVSSGISSTANGIVTTDLDGDEKCEIIVSGANGTLNVYDYNGNMLFNLSGADGHLTIPAVGNVFGNEQKEIVVSAQYEGQARNWIFIIDGNDGSMIEAFDLVYNVPTSVALKDIDADGYDDIIALTHSSNAPEPPKDSRIRIWQSTGNDWQTFPGWPEEGYILPISATFSVPAIADLDYSGKQNLIITARTLGLYSFQPIDSAEAVWIKTPTELAEGGTSGQLNTAMALADLDEDGNQDILFATSKNDRLYAVDHSGSALAGWNGGVFVQATDNWGYSGPPIVGNLDDDPQFEIVYVGRDSLYCYENDGTTKEGWPILIEGGNSTYNHNYGYLSPFNSPVIADLNQDGQSEIIFVTNFGKLHAIDAAIRKDIEGFPIDAGHDVFIGQSPSVDDIDRDGDLEVLLVNQDGIVKIWDASAKYNQATELYWSQPYGNIAHTGEFDTLHLQVVSAITNSSINSLPKNFELYQNYPNPFNPETTIRYAVAKSEHIEISIFNVLGQEITKLVDQKQDVGNYKLRFNGSKLASGIYFIHFKAGTYLETRKMVLLK